MTRRRSSRPAAASRFTVPRSITFISPTSAGWAATHAESKRHGKSEISIAPLALFQTSCSTNSVLSQRPTVDGVVLHVVIHAREVEALENPVLAGTSNGAMHETQ